MQLIFNNNHLYSTNINFYVKLYFFLYKFSYYTKIYIQSIDFRVSASLIYYMFMYIYFPEKEFHMKNSIIYKRHKTNKKYFEIKFIKNRIKSIPTFFSCFQYLILIYKIFIIYYIVIFSFNIHNHNVIAITCYCIYMFIYPYMQIHEMLITYNGWPCFNNTNLRYWFVEKDMTKYAKI